ncbi:hypothetical protein [Streptomyces sp. NPDC087859]|uniref:hypothetical protein n=1 Tax=Streptomyces sp. NPDC087859 TaxID=3365812 RepID=UPI0037F965F1
MRPELAVTLAGEIRGIELAMLAEELRVSDVGLEFLTGEFKGLHDPFGIVFTVLAAISGMEREYIRERVITTGVKKGQRPSPDAVMRMLWEHDEQAAAGA